MREHLPEPLVPADVDLSDFAFMPLDVRRLRDSRFTATVDGDAFKVGLLLWCASWHQHPAASLPDDDVELAQLAGFGRVVREWRKVRAQALYGWLLCSDGRLYHPTVAEKALEAWESKMRHAHSKMVDRVRKMNKLRSAGGLPEVMIPPFECWNSTGRVDPIAPAQAATSAGIPAEQSAPVAGIPAASSAVSGGIPAPPSELSAGIPAENALKGQGQGTEGIDREREREGARAVSTIPTPTRAGTACRCMKAAGLTAGLSPSHPKLLALLGAGISDEELADAAADAVGKGKSFAYALAIAEGRRRDAATAPLPHHTPPRQTVAERRNAVLDEMTGRSRHATRPEPEPADVIDVPFRAVE